MNCLHDFSITMKSEHENFRFRLVIWTGRIDEDFVSKNLSQNMDQLSKSAQTSGDGEFKIEFLE